MKVTRTIFVEISNRFKSLLEQKLTGKHGIYHMVDSNECHYKVKGTTTAKSYFTSSKPCQNEAVAITSNIKALITTNTVSNNLQHVNMLKNV